jgi:hypothetical protein
MGYKSGLTLQSVPYDFRLHSGYDSFSKNFGPLVKKMKEINNKKVVVLTHSMGSTKALYGLWNMNQADKDANVALFMPIAPPFIGALKPLDYLTCGTDNYYKYGAGINMKAFMMSAGSFPSIVELAPSLLYSTQKSQPWMQKILKRIDYENGISTDPVFDFLPSRDQVCYPNYNQKMCRSGLYNFVDFGKYLGSYQITLNNYRQWIDDHTFNAYSSRTWETIDKRFDSMPNPGVPVVLFYSQQVETEGYFEFNIDPKVASKAERFCTDKEKVIKPLRGDGTVPSPSVVTPALKWAIEYLEKQPNAKPIKIVEVCSQYNLKPSPYDAQTVNGAKTINKVEYIGLPCDCSEGKVRHCEHESMLFLPQLIDFMSQGLLIEERTSVSPSVNQMSEEQLQAFQQDCVIQSVLTMDNSTAEQTESRLASE